MYIDMFIHIECDWITLDNVPMDHPNDRDKLLSFLPFGNTREKKKKKKKKPGV